MVRYYNHKVNHLSGFVLRSKFLRVESRGFTITELMVALGITTLISLGVVGILYEFHVFERKVINKTEYQDYSASLQGYLTSTNGCNAALVGQTLSTTPAPFTVNGYVGFGDQVPPQAGAQISNQLSIQSLNLQEKVIAGTGESVVRIGTNLVRKTATVSLNMTAIVANQQTQERQKNIDLVVLVDNSNVIQSCVVSKDMQGACTLLGEVYDPTTKTCLPNATCQFFGRYITSSCTTSDPNYPGTMGTYPCIGAASAPGQTPNNEFTGGLSCPNGSQAFLMGETDQTNTFNVNCGKKCTETVTQNYTESYYMCLRCN